MDDELTPLIGGDSYPHDPENIHHQFCLLVGIVPSNLLPEQAKKDDRFKTFGPHTLYSRVLRKRRAQSATYVFTAALSNSLLLTQVVLGAALTGLGASQSSHILITVFGALNTVIAGLIAYLKSRGQPMRSRVFRDDLDRVVDEIENSEIMWRGIANNAHGYDEIAIDDTISVRSEVARLTRLYDKAVRGNSMNDPDTYAGGAGQEGSTAALRARPVPQSAFPAADAAAPTSNASPAKSAPPTDEQGPASAPTKPKEASVAAKDETSPGSSDTPTASSLRDPDAEPAASTGDDGYRAPAEPAAAATTTTATTAGSESPDAAPSPVKADASGSSEPNGVGGSEDGAPTQQPKAAKDPDESPATRR